MNPVGNAYCDRCHARLAPPVVSATEETKEKPLPVKGLSLPSRPEGEVEDRLAQLRPTVGEPSLGDEERGGAPPADIPEWLLQLGVVSPEALAEPESRAEVPPFLTGIVEEEPTREMPEWLAEQMLPLERGPALEVQPFPPEALEALPVKEPAPAPSAGLPDWLAELTGAAGPAAPAGPPPFLEELPGPAPEEPISPSEGPSVPPLLPEWLAEVGPVEPVEAPKVVPPIALDEREGLSAAPPKEIATKVPPFVLEEEALAGPAPAEVPDWLLAARERPETSPPTAPDFGGLVPAEIPEWLKPLRPKELGEVVEEAAEEEGLLAGLRGVLPVGRGLDMSATAPRIRPVGPTPATIARAELLQGLLARPLFQPPQEPREAARGAAGWMVSRLLVGLLLLAAILAPMLVRVPFFGTPVGSGVDQLYTQVEALSPGTPVLLAWEYGPVEAEEMDRVAGPIVIHLLRRGARGIIVSTRPEGPATAATLVNRWAPNPEAVAAQVANLGYQPGGAGGVREVLSNLGGRTEFPTGVSAADLEAMEGIQSVADVGMVILLTAQPDDLRIWVEQVATANPGVPMGAGISARVEPFAEAYLGAGQLFGLVSGWVGGAAYEQRLDTGQGRAYQYYLTSLGLAQLAVAVLMVAGAVVFLAGGRRK